MKTKTAVLALLAAAITAAPVAAGDPTSWTFVGCGGTSFETCISGSVSWTGNSITVAFTPSNLQGGLITAVGIWNLPGYSLTDTTATYYVTGDPGISGWEGPKKEIQGVVTPSQHRVAYGTSNGINAGLGLGGPYSFTFEFPKVDPASFAGEIGVGFHTQGVNGCSSKLFFNSSGVAENPFNGPDTCVSVPEPGSLLLLGSGALGLAFIASRRREDELVDEDDTTA